MVFQSGLPIVMAGLDVGLKALVLPEDSEEILHMGKVGDMAYHLFKTLPRRQLRHRPEDVRQLRCRLPAQA